MKPGEQFLVLKTAAQFLDELRAHFNVPSDYALHEPTGWKRQQTTRYRTGKSTFDDDTARKVAKWLGYDPGYVAACMAWQRARSPDQKSLWESVVKKLATSAGALLVALGIGAPEFDISIFPAPVSSARQTSDLHIMRQAARLARRLLRCAQAARSALVRYLGTIPGRAALGAL